VSVEDSAYEGAVAERAHEIFVHGWLVVVVQGDQVASVNADLQVVVEHVHDPFLTFNAPVSDGTSLAVEIGARVQADDRNDITETDTRCGSGAVAGERDGVAG
jgi:hypothetical protein